MDHLIGLGRAQASGGIPLASGIEARYRHGVSVGILFDDRVIAAGHIVEQRSIELGERGEQVESSVDEAQPALGFLAGRSKVWSKTFS